MEIKASNQEAVLGDYRVLRPIGRRENASCMLGLSAQRGWGSCWWRRGRCALGALRALRALRAGTRGCRSWWRRGCFALWASRALRALRAGTHGCDCGKDDRVCLVSDEREQGNKEE